MPNRFFTNKNKNLEIHENHYYEGVKLKNILKDNVNFIKRTLGNSSDLIIREFTVGKIDLAVIYIEGISNKDFIDNYLLSNLMIFINDNDFDNSSDIYSKLIKNQLNVSQVEECNDYKLLYKNLLYGNAIVLIDNLKVGFSLGTRYIDDRAVSVPDSEYSSKGPKDSFIETLRINTAAIRSRIKDVNLRMDSYTIGEITNTDIVVSYIKGIAPDNIVSEVKRRVESIDIDALTDSSYLKKMLRDQKYNIFPVSGSTERPDLICAKLLEGRVVIIVDGTPFVLFVPYFFKDIFKSTEEYYQSGTVSIFIRFLRYLSFFLTIFTAPIFVALATIHHEMLPVSILLSFIIQYENISTPLFVEVLLMLLVFELLKETSYRAPYLSSSVILFVSGLILSENMIIAGLISPIVIIIISITVVTNFIYRDSDIHGGIRIVRLLILLLTSFYGLLGTAMALILFIFYLCTLTTLNMNYLSSVYPYNSAHIKTKNTSLLQRTIYTLKYYLKRKGSI